MSGHSKWATIKRQKGKTDAQRGKIFTKIGREIAVAVKAGGADPNSNAKLRDVIAKAKLNNMPSDNIMRGIKKASGESGSINYEKIVYEGYGAGGVAVIVETLTDNKNRTAGEIRFIFDRAGGSLGTNGCVSYLFESKGVLQIEKDSKMNDDIVMMDAIDAGAEDFIAEETGYAIYTATNDIDTVRNALDCKGYVFVQNEVLRLPLNQMELNDEDKVKIKKMLSQFDDNDDVQLVFHNAMLDADEEDED